MLKNFLEDLKIIYNNLKDCKNPDMDDFKEKWDIKSSIGDVYQNLCKREFKKEMGSFYTPYEIIKFMVKETLKDIDYEKNPYIKIFDPSCGGGYFLIELIFHLYDMALKCGIAEPLKHVVENNIYGCDIDENAVMITIIEIYNKTGFYAKNIGLGDFLTNSSGPFDVVIGNPPYMGHKVLKSEYRNILKDSYRDVFFDKADLSYCFIKKSIDSLKPNGILCFFTSRYILEALNGKGIRNYIKKNSNIKGIIDFYGVRFIKGVGVDNIIIKIQKKGCVSVGIEQGLGNDLTFAEEKFGGSLVKSVERLDDWSAGKIRNGSCKDKGFDYYRLKANAIGEGEKIFDDIVNRKEEYSYFIDINPNDLIDEGWSFLKPIEKSILKKIHGVELSNLCSSFQGIITGYDKAYILNKDEARELNIEKELLKPWIKNKNIDKFSISESDELLIYTDIIKDENNYKNALKYIEKYKERLIKRRECALGKRKWYELQWGRKSEIFNEEKIIFPYKAGCNRFAIDKGSYFSADVYAIKINPIFESSLSYEFLVGVLNSRIYEFYIKTMAKKLGDELYEYYPNKIMKLKMPEYIKDIERVVLRQDMDIRDNIDSILMKYFGINDEEYLAIRSWCM